MKLLPFWKAEHLGDRKYGIFVTSHELSAKDNNGRDEDLTFCIVRQPYFGYLEKVSTGLSYILFHTIIAWHQIIKISLSLLLQAVWYESASLRLSSKRELLRTSSTQKESLSQTAWSLQCLIFWGTLGPPTSNNNISSTDFSWHPKKV